MVKDLLSVYEVDWKNKTVKVVEKYSDQNKPYKEG